jgi:hypothetical protein
MPETINNSQISKLAVMSLVFSALAFAMAGVSLTVWFDMRAVALCLLLITCSVIFGIAAMLSKKKVRGSKPALLSIVVSVVLYFELGPAIDTKKRIAICRNDLSNLGKSFSLYVQDNNGKYPTADKWCDLLAESDNFDNNSFLCFSALGQGDNRLCYFAINPECGPNSPDDTVLLFETKGGWNQCGGSELLNTEHHEGKGCSILFNDGSVKFIKTKKLNKLRWDNKPENDSKQ